MAFCTKGSHICRDVTTLHDGSVKVVQIVKLQTHREAGIDTEKGCYIWHRALESQDCLIFKTLKSKVGASFLDY